MSAKPDLCLVTHLVERPRTPRGSVYLVTSAQAPVDALAANRVDFERDLLILGVRHGILPAGGEHLSRRDQAYWASWPDAGNNEDPICSVPAVSVRVRLR